MAATQPLRDAGTVITLAFAAHAVSHKPPAFNGLFYATAATIIPVLFLALAVQGRLYEDLLKASAEAWWRFRRQARQGNDLPALAAFLGSFAAADAALITVLYGIGGEIQALVDLDRQRASATAWSPLAAAVILTAALGVAPAVAFARWIRQGAQEPPGAADGPAHAGARAEREPANAGDTQTADPASS